MAEIRVQNLQKKFGEFTAVKDLSFTIPDKSFFCLLGPSGCGKTTTLRMIAGLELPSSGSIFLGGEDVAFRRASERDIAFVFQLFALYPHMNVRRNIGFPLLCQGVPSAEVRARVEETAKLLRIDHLLDRRVSGLAGGDRQRVALGRAIVRHPKAFLMDEPLTNLDAELRADMRAELKHVQQRLHTTMVYVTHDQTEAMALGHRIAIMNQGRLEQVGAPMEVYERPATLFAASFIGSPPMNLIDAEVTNGHLTAAGGLALTAPDGLERGERVVAGVRPERFVVSASDDDPGAARGRVVSREALGDETIYVVETEAGMLNVRMPPTVRLAEEQPVAVRYQGTAPPVYDPESGRVTGR
jgi:multiple sugar transport system ATP-binding protein